MIDWLLRPKADPVIEVGGRPLPLIIRRHATARRLTMRMAADGTVRLTMPTWARTAEALSFARSRADWLAGQLAQLESATPPAPGGTLIYRGQEMRIDWQARAPRKPVLAEGRLLLGGPEASLAGRVQKWLEAEALRLMAEDLACFCASAGQQVPHLRLSRARSRWGSCAARGTIAINWRLIQAPDAVRRSVVAHEVAHLVHFDHSAQFHNLLGEIFDGDIKAANRWLKAHGRSLYAAFG